MFKHRHFHQHQQQHSLRVHYHVQQWKRLAAHLQPEILGWKMREDRLLPVPTDIPPAPPQLLKVLRCSCKTDCSTARCTCRKHGLECSFVCGECRGINCANASDFCTCIYILGSNKFLSSQTLLMIFRQSQHTKDILEPKTFSHP